MNPRIRTALLSVVGFTIAFAIVLLVGSLVRDDDDNTDALTVQEGLRSPSDTDIVVQGFLFYDESTGALLCSDRSDQSPPVCEGVVFQLDQMDPNRLDLVRPAEPDGAYDAYSRDSVVLLGRKSGGLLVVKDVLR